MPATPQIATWNVSAVSAQPVAEGVRLLLRTREVAPFCLIFPRARAEELGLLGDPKRHRRVIPREDNDTEAAKHALVQNLKNGGSPLGYPELCKQAGCNYNGFMAWRRRRGFVEARPEKQEATG